MPPSPPPRSPPKHRVAPAPPPPTSAKYTGPPSAETNAKELERAFRECDRSGSGWIDPGEFNSAVDRGIISIPANLTVPQVFAKFDTSHSFREGATSSGFISPPEFFAAVKSGLISLGRRPSSPSAPRRADNGLVKRQAVRCSTL